MSDLFKELRFLGLRPEDKIREAHVTPGQILEEQYNFADFHKTASGEYEIVNLMQQAGAEESSGTLNTGNKRPSGQAWAPLIYKYDESDPLRKKSYPVSDMTKKTKGKLLSAMKSWIKEKENAYEKLKKEYIKIKKSDNNIKILPISLNINFGSYHQTELSALDIINTQINILTKSFRKLIEILRSRSLYRIFSNYSRIILLDSFNKPYLHIIFYYNTDESSDELSDYFIRDIIRTWCKIFSKNEEKFNFRDMTPASNNIIPWDVSLNYIVLKRPFPVMRNDDNEEAWGRGEYVSDEGSLYKFTVSISHILQPFNRDRNKKYLAPKSLISRGSPDFSQLPSSLIKRFEENHEHMTSSDYSRFVNKADQTEKYHLYYLEQVAKQYVKIPGINNITSSLFSYRKK